MSQSRSVLKVTKAGAQTAVALAEQVEVPFNADVTNVLLTLGTAPTGAPFIVDVLKGGVSLFATALGTVAIAMVAGDLSFTMKPTTVGGVHQNQPLLIDTESVLAGVEAGSAMVTGGVSDFAVPIARAQRGTGAAGHAVGANVFPDKPFIVAGANSSGTAFFVPAVTSPSVPPLNEGDILTFAVTQIGSGTAGSDLDVEVLITQR